MSIHRKQTYLTLVGAGAGAAEALLALGSIKCRNVYIDLWGNWGNLRKFSNRLLSKASLPGINRPKRVTKDDMPLRAFPAFVRADTDEEHAKAYTPTTNNDRGEPLSKSMVRGGFQDDLSKGRLPKRFIQERAIQNAHP